jgi:hypothetical protein
MGGIDLNISEVNRRVGWEEGIKRDDGRRVQCPFITTSAASKVFLKVFS